jgi:hypothetical protein
MMGNKLIIDNWLLQDIGSCLSDGLSGESSSELVINHSSDCHSFSDVPMAGVQIEALLEFLVDIVLRDSIIVDSAFMDAWSDYENILSLLLNKGLIRGLPLYENEEQLIEPRQYALQQLCVTSTLLEAQQRNEESWAATRSPADQYMSQIIWGTAGMLSRSHVFEAPYSGHPLRKRVIEQTVLGNPQHDAVSETLNWINEERLRLFDIKAANGMQRTAVLVLPPIAIEIIEESNGIGELISIAYQLREKYAPVREWMKLVQKFMDSENPKEIAKYKKILNAVSNDLNRAIGSTDTGSITLKMGFGLPSVSIPVGTLGGVIKKFGMRAILNNQIFTAKGENSVKKLLRMFEEEKSRIGLSVQDYLRSNSRR